MKIYYEEQIKVEEQKNLLKRPAQIGAVDLESIQRLCLDVKEQGDRAVRNYSQRFDSATPDTFRVPQEEIDAAAKIISPEFRKALEQAAMNIRAFHALQLRSTQQVETVAGVRCWREVRPLETVGLYVPAGSAPLPSTVLMLGIPAQLAQCKRIILCSPPRTNGKVDPFVLATAQFIGITEIYCVGGAQAIAAMAYGTESIPKVDKIFGPGNKYVAAAKQFVSNDPDGAAIDMIAGPSEVLILADETALPEVVAWDCISQAEHDPDAQAVVVTTDSKLAKALEEALTQIPTNIPRNDIVQKALSKSFALVAKSLDSAIQFVNDYAPEHLIINVKNAEALVPKIQNAGSVFLGAYAPVTAGDYASGTNHTLPTSGAARWFSGLTVESFQKTITFQSLTKNGLQALSPTLIAFAEAEGLYAHSKSVTCRLS